MLFEGNNSFTETQYRDPYASFLKSIGNSSLEDESLAKNVAT